MEKADKNHAGRNSKATGNARASWVKAQRAWLAAGCPKNWIYRNGKLTELTDEEADIHSRKRALDEKRARRLRE